jgi:hypothetical protein
LKERKLNAQRNKTWTIVFGCAMICCIVSGFLYGLAYYTKTSFPTHKPLAIFFAFSYLASQASFTFWLANQPKDVQKASAGMQIFTWAFILIVASVVISAFTE